ncbi:Pycsar system effector family protein [Saccharopolyspora griseoalba]|uniref:Pycsar system effector family protein n=1 Tax=Saccharopolyspora griseoalba TaxID=1431848 RepID=A0ABW2LKJ3_9PSEU
MTSSDEAWKALQQTHDLIKVADTKAAAIVTGNGVLGGVLIKALPAHGTWSAAWPHVTLMLSSIAAVSASILFALRVFVPRLRNAQPESLLYFGTIARRYPEPTKFIAAYRRLLDDGSKLEEALAEQVWTTSHIARQKFRNVTPALWLLGLALITALLAGLLK